MCSAAARMRQADGHNAARHRPISDLWIVLFVSASHTESDIRAGRSTPQRRNQELNLPPYRIAARDAQVSSRRRIF